MSEDVKPRIGYVAIEDYTDDYSDWTGQITFPNPKGANIYWQNPIVFIELEPTMRMMKEMADALKGAQHMFKAIQNDVKEIHGKGCDKACSSWGHSTDCFLSNSLNEDEEVVEVNEALEKYKKFKEVLK